MDIQSLKRDSKTAETGRWVSEIPGMGDVRLQVRGLSSPTVIAYRSRKERSIPKSDRNNDGSLKAHISIRVLGDVMAEKVLLGWDGLNDNGKPIEYSKQKAKEWLTDPDFSFFADAVTWASSVVDNGTFKTKESVAKN